MSNFAKWNTGGIKLKDITAQCTFSWLTAPTGITAGTFPDSFIDGNHETKLEFFGTYGGSGSQARLRGTLPKVCFCMLLADAGVGAQIGGDSSSKREMKVDTSVLSERYASNVQVFQTSVSEASFSQRFLVSNFGSPQSYGDRIRLDFYSNTAGDYAFEIYNLRVLEIVGV